MGVVKSGAKWCGGAGKGRAGEAGQKLHYILKMKRLLATLLLVVAVLGQSALLLANSSHSVHNFQLALSLKQGTLLRIRSQKIAPSLQEWLTIDASTSPATISPELQ